jgi:hypothetical protein
MTRLCPKTAAKPDSFVDDSAYVVSPGDRFLDLDRSSEAPLIVCLMVPILDIEPSRIVTIFSSGLVLNTRFCATEQLASLYLSSLTKIFNHRI